MIVSPITLKAKSQNKDTLVYYTKSENRKIALKLEEGNYYKKQYSIDTAIISNQKLIIIENKNQLYNTNLQISYLEQISDSLLTNYINVTNDNNKLNRQAKNLTIWGLSTTASTIILIILIVL